MKNPSIKVIILVIGFFLLVGIACGTSAPSDPTATTPPEMPTEIEPIPTEEEVIEEIVLPDPTTPPSRQLHPTEQEFQEEEYVEEENWEEEPWQPEPEAFYVEEFEGDLSSWSYFMMSGDEDKMDLYTDNGRLVFDLQGREQYVYVVYDEYYYSDVEIELYAENLGKNTNNVSLVCNYSERFGWYEFNISNGGLYDILVYSELDGGYYTLTSGGSKNVRTGRNVNVYTAVCQGNQLALYINGVLEKEFIDRKYNLHEGLVGFGVSSFNVLPILVEVDYFAIREAY